MCASRFCIFDNNGLHVRLRGAAAGWAVTRGGETRCGRGMRSEKAEVISGMALWFCLWLALAAGSARAQDVTGASNCSFVPRCTGAGGVSCEYCPAECGTCASVGVIRDCVEAGVAHISIDDGPSLAGTATTLLDTLKARGVSASFWCVYCAPPCTSPPRPPPPPSAPLRAAAPERAARRAASGQTCSHAIDEWTCLRAGWRRFSLSSGGAVRVVGQNVAARPGEVARMAAEGHLVGSHSYTHAHFNGLQDGGAKLAAELAATRAAIQRAVPGYDVKYHRPPFGELSAPVLATVQAANMTAVLWTSMGDLLDWTDDAGRSRHALDQAMNLADPATTSIILLVHYTEPGMACGLDAVISRVRARGYALVSAEECFHGRGANATPYPLQRPPTTPPQNLTAEEAAICTRRDLACVDGDGCGGAVGCCAAGACCATYGEGSPTGYCVGPDDADLQPGDLAAACAAGRCLAGACAFCGDPLALRPPPDPGLRQTDSDYRCPAPPIQLLTRTVVAVLAGG